MLPWIGLSEPPYSAFNALLGVGLLVQQIRKPTALAAPQSIRITSGHAILDLTDDFGPVRLIAPDPETTVIVRVKGGNPSRLFELIEANCRVILSIGTSLSGDRRPR